MLKGIIFDMDGTITLTETLHHRALADVFDDYGINYRLERHLADFAGSGSAYTFETIFKEKGIEVSPENIEKCVAKKRMLYKKIVQKMQVPLVAGVKEFVEHTEKLGLKRIIATGNGDLDVVRSLLKSGGLLEYFPEILSIKEVARGKPFPDVFVEALNRLGLMADECVVLEDSVNGILAARDAGIRSIAFETSAGRKDLLQAGASVVLRDYFELTDKILSPGN